MQELVPVNIVDLILDQSNPRLIEEQSTQQATILAIAAKDPTKYLKLAQDIVEHQLDPTALLAVVATGDERKRYKVLEGNRRVAVLKGLETPAIVMRAFDGTRQKVMNGMSAVYAKNPIKEIQCVLFETEEEAKRWIELRHTGEMEGAGLVEWGPDEKDRWAARHGKRRPAGQLIDFVNKEGLLSPKALRSTQPVFTNVHRLLSSREVRNRVGIDIINGKIYRWYPRKEVAKSLTKIVEDLKTLKIKVKNVYHAVDRAGYARKFPKASLPKKSTRFKELQPLEGPLEAGIRLKPSRVRRKRPRKPGPTGLIPLECRLNISTPRINNIYLELKDISLDSYPNICSVGFRVFVELSVDSYILRRSLMPADKRKSTPLAKRIKVVAMHLFDKEKIDDQLRDAIVRIAESKHMLAASVPTFNMYVHNQYVFPKPSEIRLAWDELQPFMEKLWN